MKSQYEIGETKRSFEVCKFQNIIFCDGIKLNFSLNDIAFQIIKIQGVKLQINSYRIICCHQNKIITDICKSVQPASNLIYI